MIPSDIKIREFTHHLPLLNNFLPQPTPQLAINQTLIILSTRSLCLPIGCLLDHRLMFVRIVQPQAHSLWALTFQVIRWVLVLVSISTGIVVGSYGLRYLGFGFMIFPDLPILFSNFPLAWGCLVLLFRIVLIKLYLHVAFAFSLLK